MLVGKGHLRRNTKRQNVSAFVPQDKYVSVKGILNFSFSLAVGHGGAAAIQDQTAEPTLRARQNSPEDETPQSRDDASCQTTPIQLRSVATECRVEKSLYQVQASNKLLKQKLTREMREKQALKTTIRRMKSKAFLENLIKSTLEDKYSPAQVQRILKQDVKFVRKYNKEDITTALVLKSISSKAYEFMRSKNLVSLPSRRTLGRWLQDFKCVPGIQEDCLRIVKERLCHSEISHEKLVAISFDEMHLRKKVEYHGATKRVYGPCNKLQVAIIRGVTCSWKQLIYFDFDCTMSKKIFEAIVTSVERDTGGEVCAVAFDLGNKTFVSSFGLTEDHHWIASPCDSERKIYVFPDTPHMLKLCRNHILDEGIRLPPAHVDTLTRSDFIDLMDKDNSEFKMAWKLTPLHVTCTGSERQRVYLAAQLLSRTTARALHYLFGDTKKAQTKAIEKINDWFDVLNSRQLFSSNKLSCAFGVHYEDQLHALKEMEELVESIHVIGKSKQPWQQGIIMGIRSLRSLFSDLKSQHNISFILTAHLNQVRASYIYRMYMCVCVCVCVCLSLCPRLVLIFSAAEFRHFRGGFDLGG